MRRLALFLLGHVFCTFTHGPVFAADKPSPVAATVESSLATDSGQIRQFVFDGDPDTYFASKDPASADDQLTVRLDEPVAVHSISVTTGKPDGADALDAGSLQVSADGKDFETVAEFKDGAARCALEGRKIQAVRIKPSGKSEHPLVVREITIESNPSVATFKYPVEISVDVTDAPEMKDWAEQAARICERAYPMINEELKSEGFQPRHSINMRLRSDYRGVAAAGRGGIVGSAKFFKDHPDDFGAMVHETTHIVQAYRRGNNPSWLVEGVADYVRFFKYEPGKIGPINAERARYDRSYRVTAAFLAYVSEKYEPQLVLKLNKLMRDGEYKEEAFRELTGKTVQELDEEWRATLEPK